MDRDELLRAAERNAATAIDWGQAVLADATERLAPYVNQAGERIGPYIAQAGERIGPVVAQAGERIAPYVAQAGERIGPAIHEAQIRGARAAASTLGKVQPTIDHALRQAGPLADAAVKKVAPVVEDILTRIPPAVEAARGKLQDDLLPRLSDTLTAIAKQPLAAEIAPALVAATAAVSAELVKPAASTELVKPARKKKSFGRRLGVFMLVAGVVGAVAVAVKKALEPPDAGWVTHTPADAYIADPVEAADEPEPDDLVPEPADEAAGESAAPVAEFGPGSYVGDEPPEGYNVKGNTRSMKYHVPGQAMYARTTAEVWFESAEAAEKAGFTPVTR